MTSAASRDSATPQWVISRALQHALQLSDGLLEWLPIGVCVCDAEGYLVQYNNRAAEIWGQSPVIANREHRFTGAFKAYRPNGEPLRLDETPMAELLETGRPIRNRELVIERPDGSRLTILANLDPLRDEAGRLVGGVNCFQDITARKAAERRLQQREQWYRDLLEALPAALYTTDADGRITFFNEAAAELCGRRPFLGDDAWSIGSKLYWPDGKPIAQEECPTALALKTDKPVRGTEEIVERPDGTRIPVIRFPLRCTMKKAS